MKMTLRNADLEGMLAGLTKVTDSKTSLSPKVGYAVVKNKLALETALKPYNEVRDSIIQKESGGTGKVDAKENPEAFAKVMSGINEIALEEAEVDIRMITLDELGDKDIPMDIMSALGFMIE